MGLILISHHRVITRSLSCHLTFFSGRDVVRPCEGRLQQWWWWPEVAVSFEVKVEVEVAEPRPSLTDLLARPKEPRPERLAFKVACRQEVQVKELIPHQRGGHTNAIIFGLDHKIGRGWIPEFVVMNMDLSLRETGLDLLSKAREIELGNKESLPWQA